MGAGPKPLPQVGAVAVTRPWRVSFSHTPRGASFCRLGGCSVGTWRCRLPFWPLPAATACANRRLTSVRHLLTPAFSSELDRRRVGEGRHLRKESKRRAAQKPAGKLNMHIDAGFFVALLWRTASPSVGSAGSAAGGSVGGGDAAAGKLQPCHRGTGARRGLRVPACPAAGSRPPPRPAVRAAGSTLSPVAGPGAVLRRSALPLPSFLPSPSGCAAPPLPRRGAAGVSAEPLGATGRAVAPSLRSARPPSAGGPRCARAPPPPGGGRGGPGRRRLGAVSPRGARPAARQPAFRRVRGFGREGGTGVPPRVGGGW